MSSTVTWLRRSDYHILTVGMVTYTTDERFSAVRRDRPLHQPQRSSSPTDAVNVDVAKSATESDHRPTSSLPTPVAEDWMLQIRGLQEADAGEYECQVNTQHPMLSAYVTLSVLSPHASIAEGNELSVVSGSAVSLTCIIRDCPHPPSHVFWYHGERVINYDRHSRVNITSLLQTPPERGMGGTSRVVSRLVIFDVAKQHSGSYTCAPVHSTPATIHVHILHAEEQMSRQSSSGTSRISSWDIFLALQTLGPVLAFQMAFLLIPSARDEASSSCTKDAQGGCVPCVVLDVPPMCGDIDRTPLASMPREASGHNRQSPSSFEADENPYCAVGDSLSLRDMSPTGVVGAVLYEQRGRQDHCLRQTLSRSHVAAPLSAAGGSIDPLTAASHIPLYDRVLNPSSYAGIGHHHRIQSQPESDFL
ncbi:hypothetical protein BIW11_07754 [Tropilaelaps mercedesae]|uniref:Ig-like domain-containing protein n=1 Tax=Tropilaelaps mercedesae TaxID=418985 RepID=A0A1V9XSZ4_9ACAR|nr:hypothetical protein BIW11_07754 [Tropilaelaps mercedesae]